MLKVAQPTGNAFRNLKCGEIFCISPVVYNVTCCLCQTKMHLDQFPSHFQIQHLTLAEESINLEELDRKRRAKLAKDASLQDNMNIKEEDPEDDPIKQEVMFVKVDDSDEDGNCLQQLLSGSENALNKSEDLEPDNDSDEDDKCLQQLLRGSEDATNDSECEEQEFQSQPQSDGDDFKVELEVEILERKPNTRNSKKEKNKPLTEAAVTQKSDIDQFKDLSSKLENKSSTNVANLEVDELKDDFDGDDVDMDRDWSLDDKISETDSNAEDDKYNPIDDGLIFPCPICKRTYRSKKSLQKHNYGVHNPNKRPTKRKEPKTKHKCDECDEVFPSERNLASHKWKHTGIICDVCGKTFTQPGNLMRHKIRHTGIKAFKCKECEMDFFTDKELKAHMIRHTGLMPYICEICGRNCRDRGVLKAHMRRHTGERPAKCEVCGKCFFSFHDLNVHAVAHSSERPFKCDICGSTFQRKKALRIHKRIHSKDRQHLCKICGKGFAQSSGLNTHMRTHDAAIEKTTKNELALQAFNAPLLMNSSLSTHIENQTTKTTSNSEVNIPLQESSVLVQYI